MSRGKGKGRGRRKRTYRLDEIYIAKGIRSLHGCCEPCERIACIVIRTALENHYERHSVDIERDTEKESIQSSTDGHEQPAIQRGRHLAFSSATPSPVMSLLPFL